VRREVPDITATIGLIKAREARGVLSVPAAQEEEEDPREDTVEMEVAAVREGLSGLPPII